MTLPEKRKRIRQVNLGEEEIEVQIRKLKS